MPLGRHGPTAGLNRSKPLCHIETKEQFRRTGVSVEKGSGAALGARRMERSISRRTQEEERNGNVEATAAKKKKKVAN